jgi:general secretion pathway protein G
MNRYNRVVGIHAAETERDLASSKAGQGLQRAFHPSAQNQRPGNPGSKSACGVTLVELIVAIALIAILTGAALPVVRTAIKRERERELRTRLWEIRDAIDRYKDAADRGAFQIKLGSEGYPPDLETLAKGIDVQGKKIRFLRKIPIDPMTKSTDWGMRSMQDSPDSSSFGGQNVFDVYTKSLDTALDGSKYQDW